VLTYRDCGHLEWLAEVRSGRVKIMTQDSKRETTGYTDRDYVDCFGDENTLPAPVSTFILTQDWSISPKYVCIGLS